MDIKCVICGEPWEACGIESSMTAWQLKLFRKGAGCPCCEGVVRDGKRFDPERLSDFENGENDEYERILAWVEAEQDHVPVWERPDPKVLWVCGGCGVEVIGNPDYPESHPDHLEYHLPLRAKGRSWYSSHPYNRGRPEKEPAHTFYADTQDPVHVCEFCLRHCDGCGAPVCDLVDHADVYGDGWCSNLEGYNCTDLFCIECIESACSECHSLQDDCTCEEDNRNMNEKKIAECAQKIIEGWLEAGYSVKETLEAVKRGDVPTEADINSLVNALEFESVRDLSGWMIDEFNKELLEWAEHEYAAKSREKMCRSRQEFR